MKTALVYSPKYLEHETGWGHPERPDRLKAITEALEEAGLWNAESTPLISPKPAKVEDLQLAHSKEHIALVRRLSSSEFPIDGDTPARKQTYEIALLSAGGAIAAAREVWEGKADSSFALLRPPGHHATRDAGGGFCYFNNIAIAVRWLQREAGLKRALILDFDAHHGNGTQDIFYEDPSVFYISYHQWPLYPGTGRVDEVGAGEGEGYIANVPMRPGSGDPEYAVAMEEVFVPICEQFKPQIIAVSAGFDSHQRDPLASLTLSSEMFGWMMRMVEKSAREICGGKVVVMLEGGYDLQALGESSVKVLQALQGKEFEEPKEKEEPPAMVEIKKILKDYWRM